jgi:hypothetical protein
MMFRYWHGLQGVFEGYFLYILVENYENIFHEKSNYIMVAFQSKPYLYVNSQNKKSLYVHYFSKSCV